MTDIVERGRLSLTKGHEPTDEIVMGLIAEIERLRKDVENANFAMCHANDVASTVRAATIEECARVVDDMRVEGQYGEHNETCIYLAELIRALKEQK